MKTKSKEETPDSDYGTLQSIELKLVQPSKTNPRTFFNETLLNELAESIAKHGVIEPILVRPDGEKFEIIVGERRVRASRLAKLSHIPARVVEMDDQSTLEVQVIENLQRADLSPLEEARGYDKLIKEHGYTAVQLAGKVGKSASYIEKRRQLTNLTETAQKRLEEGSLTLTNALLLCRIPDQKLQEKALWKATGTTESSNLKAYIEGQVITSLSQAPFDLKDPDLLPIAGACTTCPSNTAVSKDLFDDFKGVKQCTNPSCFSKKVSAYWANVKEVCKEKGQEVLSRAESDKAFVNPAYSYGDDDKDGVKQGSDYVKADAICPIHPRKKTWRQLVDKKLTTILGLSKRNKKVELYRLDDVKKLIKGEEWYKKYSKELRKKKVSPQYDWAKEQRMKDFTARTLRDQVYDQFKQSNMVPIEIMRLVILKDVEMTNGSYELTSMMKAVGLVLPEKNPEGANTTARKMLTEYWEDATTEMIVRFLYSQIADGEAIHRSILEHFQVDLKAIDKQIKADFKESELERSRKEKEAKEAKPAGTTESQGEPSDDQDDVPDSGDVDEDEDWDEESEDDFDDEDDE